VTSYHDRIQRQGPRSPGLDVKINRVIRKKIDVADALSSHAADSGAELIAMGAYGHSRLREFI
jgi:nucleotide-binding universal stress UspA family protein